MTKPKKILYVDMDNVLVDFRSAFTHFDQKLIQDAEAINKEDEIDGLFGKMEPMPDAIKSVTFLSQHFDTYLLSTAPWRNPSAWIDKLRWVQKYLPEVMHKRLIISHHKNLNRGDYLIDDRDKNGVMEFQGQHIHFGKGDFKRWEDVIRYLCKKEMIPFPSDLFDTTSSQRLTLGQAPKMETDPDLHSFYMDMLDTYEEHEDFHRLYGEYIGTEIYTEIVDFLDNAHPEWRKGKGLGKAAPEFILSIIDEYEDYQPDGEWEYDEENDDDVFVPYKENTVVEWLTEIYRGVHSDYNSYCSFNRSNILDDVDRRVYVCDISNPDGTPCSEDEIQEIYNNELADEEEKIYWPF